MSGAAGLCCPGRENSRDFILGVAVAEDGMGPEAGNFRSWQTPGPHQQLWQFMLKPAFCPVRHCSTRAQGQLEKGTLCL